MRKFLGLALSILLLSEQSASAAKATLSAQQYCPMIAGNGIALAEMQESGAESLKRDLILQSVRLCPAEFVSTASLFPQSNTLLTGFGNPAEDDRFTVALSRDAATKIRMPSAANEVAFAKRLIDALGRPAVADSHTLLVSEQNDSRSLALMAAELKDRSGHKQNILLLGMFIMWIANRDALNQGFQAVPSSQEWLRPFPPGYVLIGSVSDTTRFEELTKMIITRAEQYSGPVDRWFRGFRIEH